MNEALKKLARETIDVQDACNLIAVANSFAKMLTRLRDQLQNAEQPHDTDAIRTHPITVCWLDKMNSLAGIQSYTDWSTEIVVEAHKKVVELANG